MTTATNTPSLIHSVYQNNKFYILTAILWATCSWMIFKHHYPYPFITTDSYFYIQGAALNADVGSWPIGYSKFIQLVGWFTHSHLVFTTVQYIILQVGFMTLFLTIRLFFKTGSVTSIILFIILFINPLFLYASNHIMSDVLFTGLSVIWVSVLLWMIIKPSPFLVLLQALLLAIIFTIRYTALFYPLVTILVFIIGPQSKWWKFTGIATTFLFLGAFILFTCNKMKEVSGIWQFQSAGGWKQASNALYMYDHVWQQDTLPVPEKFDRLHSLVRNYFQKPHMNVELINADEELTNGGFYLFARESPLMEYMRLRFGEADIFDFRNMAPFGSFYNEYGTYLIKKHPVAWMKYVLYPNLRTYITPFPEIYKKYEDPFYLWRNNTGKLAKNWFHITSVKIPIKKMNLRGSILKPYPLIFTIIHCLLIFSLLVFLLTGSHKKITAKGLYGLIILLSICFLQFVLIVLFSVSALRFQFGSIIFELIIILFITEFILSSESVLHPLHVNTQDRT